MIPIGLAAVNGNLWVSDWVTGKVWQVVANGTPLDNLVVVAEGLTNPEGLAVDRDGSLLVVESMADRLSRVNPLTGQVATVAEGLLIGAETIPAPLPPGPSTGWQWAPPE